MILNTCGRHAVLGDLSQGVAVAYILKRLTSASVDMIMRAKIAKSVQVSFRPWRRKFKRVAHRGSLASCFHLIVPACERIGFRRIWVCLLRRMWMCSLSVSRPEHSNKRNSSVRDNEEQSRYAHCLGYMMYCAILVVLNRCPDSRIIYASRGVELLLREWPVSKPHQWPDKSLLCLDYDLFKETM